MAQCLIPNLIVLANRKSPQMLTQLHGQLHSNTVMEWLLHLRPHWVGREPYRIASQCQLCEYSCCRVPVSCLLPALSHRPILRNISVVNVLSYSVSASLPIVLLKSRIRMSVLGRCGSKALLLAFHDKDEASFFIKSGTTFNTDFVTFLVLFILIGVFFVLYKYFVLLHLDFHEIPDFLRRFQLFLGQRGGTVPVMLLKISWQSPCTLYSVVL